MLGSSAETEAYLENSSPEQWHWKVVSAQQREGGRVLSAMKRLTSGGQWGRHSPYHTVCWLTWAAPDQSLYLSHSLCRTECRHSLPGMTHLRMMLWGFICIKGKVPRKEKICGLILEASQTQEINKVGDHQWSPVICGEEFLKITQETAISTHLAELNKKKHIHWLFQTGFADISGFFMTVGELYHTLNCERKSERQERTEDQSCYC